MDYLWKSYIVISSKKEIDFFMEIIINKKVYIRLIMSYCTLGLKTLDIAWSSVGRKWIYIKFRLIFSKIHVTSTLILNNSVVVNSPSPEESKFNYTRCLFGLFIIMNEA